MTRGRPIRLCYVHGGRVPAQTANAVHVAKMVSAFVGAGAKAMLVCRGNPLRGAALGRNYRLQHRYPILRLPRDAKTGGIRFFTALALAAARLSGAKIIYTRHPGVARRAAAAGWPTVFEAHAGMDFFVDQQGADLRALAASPHLIQLVAISQALADHFAEHFPQLAGRIMVAHDGADPAQPADPLPIRREGRATIGYVGHLYPGKGMEVIAQVAARCPWADFHVVGGTPDYVAQWKAQTAQLTNITFHGFVAHARTSGFLAAFDIVLAPYQRSVDIAGSKTADISRWMSPLKLFEYMAAARPIVCSRLPVLEEVLEDGRTALLCDPDDIGAWASALESLRDDPQLGARLGQTACEVFLDNYTWDRRAELILTRIAQTL